MHSVLRQQVIIKTLIWMIHMQYILVLHTTNPMVKSKAAQVIALASYHQNTDFDDPYAVYIRIAHHESNGDA